MNTKDFLFLGAVIYIGWRWQRSHSGVSAVDKAYATDAAQFAGMAGTNFTNSVWDAASGQPSYMYGTVPAPGGLSVTPGAPVFRASIFGHI
ncbi:hypothetical protein [Burkholderia stagnalis]|uniref:hypothetical protein n=1 Tax=Burkholderia stagnalis TaxID=1503054 RepID=UPI000F55F119|nr:hypothetical protein [Burkholderia stagnalis]RQQ65543.1 hypothetical protein DF137_22430 [Burkholderia stagnalis]RQQ78177.1 hypothetical protein DF138_21725 [Burkholderia stagnalis]RQQ87780.1 hypothetical protein DF136_21395 [Burkholderia stagnalis]